MLKSVDPELISVARASAARAAERSGVEITELTDLVQLEQCEALFADLWGREAGPPLAANVLRAMVSAGCYVSGAYADGLDGDRELLAGCVGWWGPVDRPHLHSHITGVAVRARGRDIGFAIKLHQRVAALAHGVRVVNWTYDPLIARNAHFNLRKLGGRAATYAPNYYGNMPDAINGGDETDRMLLRWELDSPRVRAACDGFTEVTPTGDRPAGAERWVEVPADIEALRRADPEAGRVWRRQLRNVLMPLLDQGWQVVDFDRGTSRYLLRKGS